MSGSVREVGVRLEPGWLRTELHVASKVNPKSFPTRVTVLAGFTWTSGDQLRAAAALLAEEADRLDDAIADDGHQLTIEEASS